VVAPGGTITRTVWTCPQRVASVWVGTDDTGATDAHPAPRATYIQGGANSTVASAVGVTLTGVTAGNTLLAYAAAQSTSAPSSSAVSDNQGNTWTLVQSQAGASTSAGAAGLWVAYNVAGGDTTIGFDAGFLGGCGLAVAEYFNFSGVGSIDASSSNSTSTASTTPAPGSLSTTHPIDLIFAGANEAHTNVTWTAGAGYTLRNFVGSGGHMAIAIEDQLVFSAGTYSPSFTTSASTVWTSIAAAVVSANNMVQVTANQWDGGSAGGDHNLTQQTQYTSSTATRVTSFGYDWRDRRTSMTDALSGYAVYTYDNLDRQTEVQRYASSGGNLISQNATNYDDRSRAYQQIVYAVDPSTGTVGNALTGNSWYDLSGNLLQQIRPGDGQVFTKSAYNGVGWINATYTGYNTSGTSYSQAGTVANDVILEQTQNTFDEVGNVVSQASFQRLNDAPSTGSGSAGALSYGTQPKARVSYTASWFDGIDRNIATANYGAIASFTRPSTPPSSSSTVLVRTTSYNEAGQPSQTTDPMGYVTQTSFDNANRKTQLIEDYGTGLLNRTTSWTYTLDNLIATMTAVNATTGNQTTTWTFGTNLTTSGVARNDLLTSVTYPDSVGGSDAVSYTYNTQGQQTTITDQRGTVRTLDYDGLGRRTDDCVTTVGSSTDNAVLRISTTYEVRGMVATVTSFDNATPGSGTALNQCALTYNSFAQLTKEQQDHNGAVSGSSPSVQYGYDSGASSPNEIRLNGLTYPNGRVITYSYGTSGGMNDLLNRVDTIQDTTSGTTDLASYTYLGLGTVVRIEYPEPEIWLDLWGGTSGTFNGLDLFNRITDQRWQNTIAGTPTDIDRYQYGYDQNSNRLYKANVVGTPIVTGGLDEFYAYDHLKRLIDMQRGTLNSGKTGIAGTPSAEQTWSLDETGNWSGFVTTASGTTNLNQTRTSNPVNEITNITESTGPTWIVPAYDAAGNTTTIPQVVDPTQSFVALYDAWNRMVKISSGGATVATYAYDGRNWRIVKATSAETRHFYFTDDWQDIEERVGASTSMDKQYVWGIRYVDELVCRDDATPERLYACQDANFNLTAISVASGTPQERYLFDPYGNRTTMNGSWSVISSSSYGWVVGRQGLIHDGESGLIYNRARTVHVALGVFLCRDPLGYLDGPSLYRYLRENPILHFDPLGTDAAECRRTASRNAAIRTFRCNDADVKARRQCEKLKSDPSASNECLQQANLDLTACHKQAAADDNMDTKDCNDGGACKPIDCLKQASPCFDAADKARRRCAEISRMGGKPDECERHATADLEKCLADKGCAK
jgi:RHS repeat-associated protein